MVTPSTGEGICAMYGLAADILALRCIELSGLGSVGVLEEMGQPS